MHKKIFYLKFPVAGGKGFLLTLLLLICLVCSCSVTRFTEQRLAISRRLSIPVSFIIYAALPPDWNKIYDTLNGYAARLDYRNEESTVSRLNRYSEAQLEPDVYRLLETAVHFAELSGGAFDPTILPLVQLWNIQDEELPAPESQVPYPAASGLARRYVA